jgi:hypothetical protein
MLRVTDEDAPRDVCPERVRLRPRDVRDDDPVVRLHRCVAREVGVTVVLERRLPLGCASQCRTVRVHRLRGGVEFRTRVGDRPPVAVDDGGERPVVTGERRRLGLQVDHVDERRTGLTRDRRDDGDDRVVDERKGERCAHVGVVGMGERRRVRGERDAVGGRADSDELLVGTRHDTHLVEVQIVERDDPVGDAPRAVFLSQIRVYHVLVTRPKHRVFGAGLRLQLDRIEPRVEFARSARRVGLQILLYVRLQLFRRLHMDDGADARGDHHDSQERERQFRSVRASDDTREQSSEPSASHMLDKYNVRYKRSAAIISVETRRERKTEAS